MRMRRLSCVSSVIAMALAGSAQAAEWNANVSLASDYIVRGLTRSLSGAAAQGSIALQGERSWATGVWASSVELYEGAGRHAEVDYFVSGELPLSRDWRFGGQATRYEFTGESRYFSYDYTDVGVSLSFQDTITASVAWSPDYAYYGRYGPVPDDTMLSYELFARYPVGRYVLLTGGVGRTDLASHDNAYNFWSGGGVVSWQRLSLSFSYVGTNGAARHLFGDLAAQDVWVATLSFRLR